MSRDHARLALATIRLVNGTVALLAPETMLRRLGVQIDSQQIRLRNVAAVTVTATLPPFAKQGTKIDVTVASRTPSACYRCGFVAAMSKSTAAGSMAACT